ncbi:MAG: N-acetyltransferase [Oscillospiraceae bacterium]
MQNFIIRNEVEPDYFTVENLTREAFWNVYRPGCDEHLVVHNLRALPCYLPALDFVAERDGELIGHILYSRSYVTLPDGSRRVFLAFGPLSVRPDVQKTGIGSALVWHSLARAAELGDTAVFITGNHDYYSRFGFETAADYGIRLEGHAGG